MTNNITTTTLASNGTGSSNSSPSKYNKSNYNDNSDDDNGVADNTSDASKRLTTIPSNLSIMALEQKLKQLRELTTQQGQQLTQKLATTQSGQNLLHMGSSLSTLPPDLHSLLTQLHPLVTAVEKVEVEQFQVLQQHAEQVIAIRQEQRRVFHADECAIAYADLVAAEQAIQRNIHQRRFGTLKFFETAAPHDGADNHAKNNNNNNNSKKQTKDHSDLDGGDSEEDEEDEDDQGSGQQDHLYDALDHAASLERAAHIALCLIADLQAANDSVSSSSGKSVGNSTPTATTSADMKNSSTNTSMNKLPNLRSPLPVDTEQAEFFMKLAPRIRRLESDTTICLGQHLELLLKQLPNVVEAAATTTSNDENYNLNGSTEERNNNNNPDVTARNSSADDSSTTSIHLSMLLLMLGHVIRGMAYLDRGKDVESIFARVAIMPVLRPIISMGRLDQGGARGECVGLVSMLQEITDKVAQQYGSLLRLAEQEFFSGSTAVAADAVDLLTAGVWVPIATTLMADPAIKMAIFSPGIAHVLQSNYLALEAFLALLARNLLSTASTQSRASAADPHAVYYYQPEITDEMLTRAQNRIYRHAKTTEFAKKWNLPIYYQLRFGECCKRLNLAVDLTRKEGWVSTTVFTGGITFLPDNSNANSIMDAMEQLKSQHGLELQLFLELYDILLYLWRPDVILTPLTNRFLRGAIQLMNRVIAFIREGMDGTLMFGEEPPQPLASDNTNKEEEKNGSNDTSAITNGDQQQQQQLVYPNRRSYCWGDSEGDVAAVAWEMSIMEAMMRQHYVKIVLDALQGSIVQLTLAEYEESSTIITAVLNEAAEQFQPLIDKAWNEKIVAILINKCSAPLAAVKGVAATYRMTNRPPPTQASPFVSTILRPLKEFVAEFATRIPERVGLRWKQQIVVTVADRYAAAVDELIATVQRTEVALQRQNTRNRRARMAAAGVMSDGEKVKLQLYLDYLTFSASVEEAGINPSTVIGLIKLQELTKEGESLQQTENGK